MGTIYTTEPQELANVSSLLAFISANNALVISTHKCAFFIANESYALDRTTSSICLTMELIACSLSFALEHISETSRTCSAFDGPNERRIRASQNRLRKGMSYLSAAMSSEQTCFSTLSSGSRVPQQRNSRRQSSSSWLSSGSEMVASAGALHSSEDNTVLKISDLVACKRLRIQ